MRTNTWGSYDRRKDCIPAYWVTEFGVLKECHVEGCHPLYWKKEPPSDEDLLAMKQKSKNPREFAMLIYEWCWSEKATKTKGEAETEDGYETEDD